MKELRDNVYEFVRDNAIDIHSKYTHPNWCAKIASLRFGVLYESS